MRLQASLHGHEEDKYRVRFEWQGSIPFSAVLETAGNMPIPPYLRRFAEPSDTVRYQTVYARERGSVPLLRRFAFYGNLVVGIGKQRHTNSLSEPSCGSRYVQAVNARYYRAYDALRTFVSLEFLRQLLRHEGPVVPVGTTSCRCLESLYYLGVKPQKFDPVLWTNGRRTAVARICRTKKPWDI